MPSFVDLADFFEATLQNKTGKNTDKIHLILAHTQKKASPCENYLIISAAKVLWASYKWH